MVEANLCYECRLKEIGKPQTEKQHFAGRHNDPFSLRVPANEHRILSDYQMEWPTDTLRNPTGDPVLKISATIRGWLDLLRLFLERIFGWIPNFLEKLHVFLVRKLGPKWWTDISD
jgi:hypothetical protein